MAKVGGRSAPVAWIVGLLCAGVIVALAALAMPLLPVGIAWLSGDAPTSSPVADPDAERAPDGMPAECRQLYTDDLWRELVRTDEAILSPSTDLPATAVASLVDALQPTVRLTCQWTSAAGEISTTFADVPTDAGAIAKTALPTEGFECADVDARVRCVLTDGDRIETIETGDGRWLSTVADGWHPDDYVDLTAAEIWPDVPDESDGTATPEPSEAAEG